MTHYQYQPPNGPAYQPMAAPPKKKSKALVVTLSIVGGLVLLCGGGAVACTALVGKAASDVSTDMAKEASVKKAGVSIKPGTCKASQFGGYDVTVTIKNGTTKVQSYWVQVNLETADGKTRLGEAHAIANDLTAGATQDVETSGSATSFPAGAKCIIGDIS